MSKIKNYYLPGSAYGWELWAKKEGEVSFVKSFDEKLPSLDESSLVMLPVGDTNCTIEQVFSGDLETEILAVETAIEARNIDGINSGQIGVYKISQVLDKSLYLGVSICDESRIPSKCLNARFDYSARARSINGELAFWQEQGRWVYGCYKDDKCIYADVLSEGALEVQLKGLLPIIVMKLSMFGIEFRVDRAVIEEAIGKVETDIDRCAESLACEVVSVNRSKLIHLSVEGLDYCPKIIEKLRLRKRRKTKGLLVILLAMIGIFALVWVLLEKRNKLSSVISENKKVIQQYQPIVDENSEHLKKMNELEQLVTEHWALSDYSEVVKSIPEGDRLIRIEMLEFRSGYLQIRGRASSYASANEFGTSLKRNSHFEGYTWNKIAPIQALDKSHWKFDYRAEIKKEGYE